MYGFNFSNKGNTKSIVFYWKGSACSTCCMSIVCEETFLFKDIFTIGHILAAIYLSWDCVREKLLQAERGLEHLLSSNHKYMSFRDLTIMVTLPHS